MKDVMEIARLIDSLDEEGASKEIFELVKKDKQFLYDIVQVYIQEILSDVLTIKHIVHDYHNPISLEEEAEKDGAETE